MLARADNPEQAGSRNVVSLINDLIKNCDIFIADVTYVTSYKTFAKTGEEERNKGSINSNVAIELGQAKALAGDARIVKVMNAYYGSPRNGLEMPFDIEQDRRPHEYTLSESDTRDLYKGKFKALGDFFYSALSNIIREHDALQKERYKYFLTYKKWADFVKQDYEYILIESLNQKRNLLLSQLKAPQSVTRIVGLSGIGKTRFVFESLRDTSISVLYYDTGSNDSHAITDHISALTAEGEVFVFVIDNVVAELHTKLSKIITRNSCHSILITIAPESEKPNLFGSSAHVIQLDTLDGAKIAVLLLKKRFPQKDYIELRHAIASVGSLPSLAVILAKQMNVDVHNFSLTTEANIVNAILGKDAEDAHNRAILRAIAVFKLVGYEGELVSEAQLLAQTDLIIPLIGFNIEQRWPKFQRVVENFTDRGIIKRKGRYITIEPKYLAYPLAQEWWKEQIYLNQISKILETCETTSLAIKLFEQLGQLSRLPIAQDLVKSLYESDGLFGNLDSILTTSGANFFNSLAETAPDVLTQYIVRVILPLSIENIFKFRDSRRSLVWGLEKLCRYKNTFERAAKVLFHFAVAENEAIVNNASGQFSQLFQCWLSGTEANYPSRLNVLEYGIRRNEIRFDELIITACASALHPERGMRIIGIHEQQTPWQEYEPKTFNDIYGYWQQIVTILMKYAEESISPQNYRAGNIIIAALPKVTELGGMEIVLGAFDRLITKDQAYWKQIQHSVKWVLHNKMIYLSEDTIQQLNSLIQRTEPITFEDKLQRYVFAFADPIDSQELGKELLQARAEALAPEFIQSPTLWGNIIIQAYKAPNPFHTAALFRETAVLLANSQEQITRMADILLKKLLDIEQGEYTLSPLTGFFAGLTPVVQKRILRKLLNNKLLRPYAIAVVRTTKYSKAIANRLLKLIEQRKLEVGEFYSLRYGSFLAELPTKEFKRLIAQIVEINIAGKWVVLGLLWDNLDKVGADFCQPLINELLLTDGLWSVEVDYLLENQAIHCLTRLIQETVEKELIETATQQVINFANTRSEIYYRMRGHAYLPLQALLKHHFNISWPILAKALAEEEYTSLYGDIGSSTDTRPTNGTQVEREGLLFEYGDYNVIFAWCHQQEIKTLLNLSRVLPIFDLSSADSWHPFTRRFIDEFGEEELILQEIQARMNSFSSSGSVEDMYYSHLALFKHLVNHSIPNVMVWANKQIQFLPKIIKGEKDFWDEWYLT